MFHMRFSWYVNSMTLRRIPAKFMIWSGNHQPWPFMDTVGCDGKERFMTQQQVIIVRQEKSMAAAYVLLIFLGQFGIHRFYVGKVGTATPTIPELIQALSKTKVTS